MGVSVAELSITVDTSDVSRGEKSLDKLGATSDRTEKRVKSAGASMSKSAKSAKTMGSNANLAGNHVEVMGRKTRAATAHTANLTAQFNDIGVMLAAGQSPLQLAMQQGTQINQVFAQLGGGTTALKAIAPAIMSMISPLSLLTIGLIAGTAALTQWVMGASSAGDEGRDLSEIIEDMSASLEVYDAAATQATLSQSGMFKEFGTASPLLQSILADLAGLEKLKAYEGIDAASRAVKNLITDLSWFDDRNANSATLDFLGLSSMRKTARELGAQFLQNLNVLSASEDPAQKLAAAIDLREVLLENTGGIGGMTSAQREFYSGLIAIIRDMELLGVKVEGVESKLNGVSTAVSSAAQYAAEMRLESSAAEKTASGLLSKLTAQADMQSLVAQYGADSLDVRIAQISAERAIFEEKVSALSVAESTKAELMAGWDAANGIASAGMSGNIDLAVQSAASLAQYLGVSLATAQKIAGLQGAGGGRGGDPRKHGDTPWERQLSELTDNRVLEMPKPPKRKPSKARGGRKKNVVDIFSRSNEELEQLRLEIELIGKSEMEVAKLTAAHKLMAAAKKAGISLDAKVAGSSTTVREKIEEQADAIARLSEQHRLGLETQESFDRGIEDISSAMGDAIVNGESLGDAFSGVLKRMAADIISSDISNLLGQMLTPSGGSGGGFLSGLLGGGSGGGLFGGSGFLGLFDSGGSIGANQWGIAGENGAEIIRGPAHVTSTRETAQMMGGGKDVNVKITLDSPMLHAEITNGAAEVVRSDAPMATKRAVAATDSAMRKTSAFGGNL